VPACATVARARPVSVFGIHMQRRSAEPTRAPHADRAGAACRRSFSARAMRRHALRGAKLHKLRQALAGGGHAWNTSGFVGEETKRRRDRRAPH